MNFGPEKLVGIVYVEQSQHPQLLSATYLIEHHVEVSSVGLR